MRRGWCLLALSVTMALCPATAWSAIAFDVATDGGNNGGTATSLTFNHTCAAGASLLVGVIGDTQAGAADDITSVTYGGTAMSLVTKNIPGAGSGDRYQYLYALGSCASGAHAVAITSAGTHYLFGMSASYTGVNTSSPIQTSTTNVGGTAASLTTSLTTSTANEWIVAFVQSFESGTAMAPTAGAGAVRRTYGASAVALGYPSLFDSGVALSAGSHSIQTCLSNCTTAVGALNLTHIVVALNVPAGAPVGGNGSIMLVGVGK
jgi:hypothetical protein